jgi:glycosyltransferase involved in cell wall biosynthesis
MESKQETLVVISPGFPENEADTTCLPFQQSLLRTLGDICPGLKIIVIAFQYPFSPAQYEWNGIEVIAIGGKNRGRLFRMLTWIKAWLILRKLNKKHQILGLLSFWLGECAFVGHYFAGRHNLSHNAWLLGQDVKKGNKYFKWIEPRGDSLIALSDFLAAEVKRNYGISVPNVIPAGIDTSQFPEHWVKRDIDVIGVGSLIPLKQYHLFVEAIGLLKTHFPDIKAVLCGKGPELEALKTLTTELGLDDNITFAGELPHSEILQMMQRSKLLLHPSSYEGFCGVLPEALYAGAHVVSFCKPMNRNYRHHYVVRDVAEMHKAVLVILRNGRRSNDRVLCADITDVAKNLICLFAG